MKGYKAGPFRICYSVWATPYDLLSNLHATFEMDAMPSTFLTIPKSIRKRIYLFANLVRECPIYLIRREDGEGRKLRLPRSVPWRAQLATRRTGCPFHQDPHALEPGMGSDICPHIPSQLLFLNKLIHSEVQELLYSMNKFVVRGRDAEDFESFQALSNEGIQKMRYLLVRLNSQPYCRSDHHWSHDKETGECRECQKLGSGSIIKCWEAVCNRLAAIPPGCLTVEFICDAKDLTTAEQFLSPMNALPRLKQCTIQLGRQHDSDLTSLARSTILRLTGGVQHLESSSSPFPFLSLPTEIRLLILKFANLVPQSSNADDNIIITKNHFDVRLSLSYFHAYGKCRCRCAFNRRHCSCQTYYASDSAACKCRLLPLNLLQVSRQVYLEASELLYSKNTFIFGSPLPDILKLLESLRPETLRHFRRIGFDLGTIYRRIGFARQDGTKWTWEDFDKDWVSLLSFIAKKFETSKLLIKIDTYFDNAFTYYGPFYRSHYDAYIGMVKGVKRCLGSDLQDFHISLRLYPQLEPELERYVMGSDYKSGKGPYPRVSPGPRGRGSTTPVDIPSLHNDFQ